MTPTRRVLVTALLLGNVAAYLGGSAPAQGASGAAGALGSLNLRGLDQSAIERSLSGSSEALVRDYASKTYGLSPEDLRLTRAGAQVIPKGVDAQNMSASELLARTSRIQEDLDAEDLRAAAATQVTVEAKMSQQLLDGTMDSMKSSYDEAVSLALDRLKEQITVITQYFQKFPSVVVACT